MDSYEYYLLYHNNQHEFLNKVTEDNEEILISINKLSKNGKLEEDRELIFNKLLNFIENDTSSNFNFDEILENIITEGLFLSSKKFLNNPDLTLSSLRIAKTLLNYALINSSADNDIRLFCKLLIANIFKESTLHQQSIAILYGIMKRNEELKNFILDLIIDTSFQRNDHLSMKNLCYFYKEICQNGLTQNYLELLERYLGSEKMEVKKQGIFMVKCLLEYNLLEHVDNWKIFITIFETMEENQSHLILPSLKLLQEIKITKEFEQFWFILCSMVINHNNNLVKKFGLNYIFNIEKKNFQRNEIFKILEAINVTNLYDPKESNFIENIEHFVINNREIVFELLVEVNWSSVPFYYVLKSFRHINIKFDPNATETKTFLSNFEKQTNLIPKRIKNLGIRNLVQKLYANILEKIIPCVDVQLTLQIIKNIFEIAKNDECLDKCLDQIKREDYEAILAYEFDNDFLKYFLLRTHKEKSLDEIKSNVAHIKNNQMLIMEVILIFNELFDGYEDIPDILIHDAIELIWIHLRDKNDKELEKSINLLETGLKSITDRKEAEMLDHLTEIWTKLKGISEIDENFRSSYLKLTGIVLNFNDNFDSKFVEDEIFSSKSTQRDLMQLTNCQALILRNHYRNQFVQRTERMNMIIENIEILLDSLSADADLWQIFEIIQCFILNLTTEMYENQSILYKIENILKSLIQTSITTIDMSKSFWERFIQLSRDSIEKSDYSAIWIACLKDIFEFFNNSLSENDKIKLHLAMYSYVEKSSATKLECILIEFFKHHLIDAMYSVNIMTRDEQIENELLSLEQEDLIQKIIFRLQVAQLFSNIWPDEFSAVIGERIIEMSAISKQKVRYYPNSKIHRQKMRHFQPLVFCNNIDQNVIDALIYELLWINNQLNIIYILEILLASHCPDIIDLLNDDSRELNTQSLKSIFTIATIQIRAEKRFEVAEKMLEKLFKKIFSYAMGQNFGVRIYTLLAIVISLEHVRGLDNFRNTPVILNISEIYDIILDSVQRKNCLKYFNALKNDFRFTRDLSELKSYYVFYQDIPTVTRMPFEEIIGNKNREIRNFLAADVGADENDCAVLIDELEFKVDERAINASTNLQRKYLPLKNQMPMESLLRTLPERFKSINIDDGFLESKSELILVASLIDNNTNLGGLARTCEIFGISKYVVHSLKSQENFEFKTLSRTSEKWINMTEVKSWHLFEYLLAMKQMGYTIVGAEQCSTSVSLLNVEFPKRCIFLLGNEKKGIPANLLSLLDLVVEIPQAGVVRSLNVHVAGAILIWEYTKQHNF